MAGSSMRADDRGRVRYRSSTWGRAFLVVLDAGHAGQRELDDARLAASSATPSTASASTPPAAASPRSFIPHADTTIQFEPQIERFLALTDPALVNLCLDVGHHAYAGGDAVRFFGDHHARIPYLHLKDVDPVLCERALTRGLADGSSGRPRARSSTWARAAWISRP